MDAGYSKASYTVQQLRGPAGTITNLGNGRYKISVTWANIGNIYNNRSDFILLTTDNAGYQSAPAYVSIKHIQAGETTFYGVDAYPNPPMSAAMTLASDSNTATNTSSTAIDPSSTAFVLRSHKPKHTKRSTGVPAPVFSTVPIKVMKSKHVSGVQELLASEDVLLGLRKFGFRGL